MKRTHMSLIYLLEYYYQRMVNFKKMIIKIITVLKNNDHLLLLKAAWQQPYSKMGSKVHNDYCNGTCWI